MRLFFSATWTVVAGYIGGILAVVAVVTNLPLRISPPHGSLAAVGLILVIALTAFVTVAAENHHLKHPVLDTQGVAPRGARHATVSATRADQD